MKKCSRCRDFKLCSGFHKSKNSKDGLKAACKECTSKASSKYWYENKDRLKKQNNARSRKYHYSRLEEERERLRRSYRENREKRLEYAKKYRKNNLNIILEKQKIYLRKKRQDPKTKLKNSIRSMIRQSLKGNKNGRSWESLVGYTLNNLKRHLEKLFKENMTWNNYGQGGWEIDHKIPISVFNFNKPEDIDFKRCWALSNLQPMWYKENRSKNAKLYRSFQPSLAF